MYYLRVFFCCLTGTTLFTTMLTVIIVMCSLKSMWVPSLIVIDYCVSKLHGHVYTCMSLFNCNVWPEAIQCCFTRTAKFTCLYDER